MDVGHGFGCKNSDNWMDEQVNTPSWPMLWLAGIPQKRNCNAWGFKHTFFM